MGFSLSDIVNNAPLMVLTATSILVLLIESTRAGRPAASYLASLVGLAAAGFLAAMGFSLMENHEGTSFGGMLLHGGYADYFALIFVASAFLTILLSRSYLERQQTHRGEYYVLILFATVGMMLMASANDLMVLFLGVELMSICLYVLAGFMRTKDKSNESALKYFLLGAFATGFLLYGIALIYGSAGTTNLRLIKSEFGSIATNTLFLTGVGLVIVGFLFKVAAVPFHMWAPDVYEGAPTTVTAFMSTGAKAAAFAALISVFIRSLDFVGANINQVIAFISAASMILGNVVAIAQTNIKRMLAYSSIAHAGYMLAGIAAASIDGQTGVLFYLAAYTFMNLGAFAIVGFMEQAEDKNLLLEDYSGLSRQRPLLAAFMAMFMFSLAGIPPFAGFFGKYYVFLAAVEANMTWLAIIGVLTSLVSAYYYLRVVVLMYFRDGQSDVAAEPSIAAMVAVTISAILVLQLGVYPSFVVHLTQRFF